MFNFPFHQKDFFLKKKSYTQVQNSVGKCTNDKCWAHKHTTGCILTDPRSCSKVKPVEKLERCRQCSCEERAWCFAAGVEYFVRAWQSCWLLTELLKWPPLEKAKPAIWRASPALLEKCERQAGQVITKVASLLLYYPPRGLSGRQEKVQPAKECLSLGEEGELLRMLVRCLEASKHSKKHHSCTADFGTPGKSAFYAFWVWLTCMDTNVAVLYFFIIFFKKGFSHFCEFFWGGLGNCLRQQQAIYSCIFVIHLQTCLTPAKMLWAELFLAFIVTKQSQTVFFLKSGETYHVKVWGFFFCMAVSML